MNIHFESKPFYYRLFGDYALFTDPVTKGGGEKFTYQVPTYQALKGITEQIYWKATIIIYIDAVKVMKKIQTETKGVRTPLKKGPKTPLKKGPNELNYHTYLRDVEYLVKFHFEWNYNHPELKDDRNEIKHQQIFLRSLSKGGRRDIFLGTRECIGYIERIRENDFYSAKSYYDNSNLSFGIMFHSFTYPSEASHFNENYLVSNFTDIKMENGLINFIRPEDCKIHHNLKKYTFKKFNRDNMIFADDEINYLDKEVK